MQQASVNDRVRGRDSMLLHCPVVPFSVRFRPVSKLYNMDCVAGMRCYRDNFFDLAVVDPPYGINIEKGMLIAMQGGKAKGWDKHPPEIDYFIELFRVSKHQIVWGANHFISRMPYDSSCWLVWDKRQPESFSFASSELAWTSFPSVVKTFYWYPQKNNRNRIHPTQKPIALYEWILRKYARTGYRILDTHVGSGSSRIACYLNGLDFFGFELDKEYCQASEKRFQHTILQGRLFTGLDN